MIAGHQGDEGNGDPWATRPISHLGNEVPGSLHHLDNLDTWGTMWARNIGTPSAAGTRVSHGPGDQATNAPSWSIDQRHQGRGGAIKSRKLGGR